MDDLPSVINLGNNQGKIAVGFGSISKSQMPIAEYQCCLRFDDRHFQFIEVEISHLFASRIGLLVSV